MSKAIDFIFQKTSERIGRKIKEVGKPYRDIFISDQKILSCIVNCKCTEKNKFLIPDRVFSDPKYKDGLIPKLFFPQKGGDFKVPSDKMKAYKCEILWGTEEERKGYAKELFEKIMWDLYNSEENIKNGKYEDIFCAFVPYAKAYTYKQIIFSETNKHPALYFGVREDDIIDPEKYLPRAINFLYCEVKEQYHDALIDYTNEKDTFSHIDKDFSSTFVQGKLIPILERYIEQDHPLGLRVRELIQGELSLVPTMFDKTMDQKQKEYYKSLNRATTNYFLALENIQIKKHQ